MRNRSRKFDFPDAFGPSRKTRLLRAASMVVKFRQFSTQTDVTRSVLSAARAIRTISPWQQRPAVRFERVSTIPTTPVDVLRAYCTTQLSSAAQDPCPSQASATIHRWRVSRDPTGKTVSSTGQLERRRARPVSIGGQHAISWGPAFYSLLPTPYSLFPRPSAPRSPAPGRWSIPRRAAARPWRSAPPPRGSPPASARKGPGAGSGSPTLSRLPA